MDFSFLKGKGLDVGPAPAPGFGDVPHHYKEPDNFYTLKDSHAPGSLDFIISKDLIFATKFHRILLKEWMAAIKEGGSVVVLFKREGRKGISFLRDELFRLFGNGIELDWDPDGKDRWIAVIRKREVSGEKDDELSKWSFGIITNGKNDKAVERIIRSILAQKIPETQIIVCGKYANAPGDKIDYIEFSEKDERGWITRKKNLVMEKARFENVAIVHDRIVFSDGWYDGMKRYGNDFDVLSCVITLEGTDKRAGDWVAADKIYGHLDYRDWDEKGFIQGMLYILKKRVWRRAPWNEYLFWEEGEDLELSQRYHRLGIVPRFNPHAACITTVLRHRIRDFAFDRKTLGMPKMPIWEFAYHHLKDSIIFRPYSVLESLIPQLFIMRSGKGFMFISKDQKYRFAPGYQIKDEGGHERLRINAIRQMGRERVYFDGDELGGKSGRYVGRENRGRLFIFSDGTK